MKFNIRRISACGILFGAMAVISVIALSCNNPVGGNNKRYNWTPEYTCAEQISFDDTLKRERPDLGLANAIVIIFNNGAPPTIDVVDAISDLITVSIFNGEHVTVRNTGTIPGEYNVILSGTTKNGSIITYGGRGFGLYLNGVNITNPRGPAINIQNSGNTSRISVHLVGGCDKRNILQDGAFYGEPPDGEQAKGTFFSERYIVFSGSGSLEIRSKYNHAIVVDNSLKILSGRFFIYESANSGIRANDSILISGGTLQIKSRGHAIRNRRDLPIRITGGQITAFTTGIKSHGITGRNNVYIGGGANIDITAIGNGGKGILANEHVQITSGNIKLRITGDRDIAPHDTSRAMGIKADKLFNFTGGQLTITCTGNGSRGIRTDGDASISGGSIHVEAHREGILAYGDLRIIGGRVYARSATREAIVCAGEYTKGDGAIIEAINGGNNRF